MSRLVQIAIVLTIAGLALAVAFTPRIRSRR
jgi:hypothetical protein